jgi:hypothetical protein
MEWLAQDKNLFVDTVALILKLPGEAEYKLGTSKKVQAGNTGKFMFGNFIIFE